MATRKNPAPARRTPGKPERVIVRRDGRTVHVWRIRSASDEEGMDWLGAHRVRVDQIIYPRGGGWYDLSGQPTDAYGNRVGTTRPRHRDPVAEKTTRSARGVKAAVRREASKAAGTPPRARKTTAAAARKVAKPKPVKRATTRKK